MATYLVHILHVQEINSFNLSTENAKHCIKVKLRGGGGGGGGGGPMGIFCET